MIASLPRRILVTLGLCSLTACLQPTDTGVSSVWLAGRWRYTATQSGASAEIMSGTLVITQQTGASFQGSLEITSTSSVTGEVRSLAGTVSGAAAAAAGIDFDVFLEQLPRRHVAQLAGDTLRGTWLRLSEQGVSASGTFTAQRLRD